MVEEVSKIKSSLKMQYEAESAVIKKKLGDIDQIRGDLRLSKRQMAQILLVDPSSLTRWQKEETTPPYIYRSLQWYLALIDKHPEWHPQNRFGYPRSSNEILLLKNEIEKLKHQSNQGLQSVEKQILSKKNTVNLVLFMTSTVCFFAGIFITYIIMR